MSVSLIRVLLIVVVFALWWGGKTSAAGAFEEKGKVVNLPKGQIELPGGYTHEKLQGFDSVPGRIVKDGAPQIRYSIGRITKPGALRTGWFFRE